MRQNLLHMVQIATLNLHAPVTATEPGKELLIPGLLHFAISQIPILVPIDTACIQTNAVSARVAVTIRKAGGVIQKASVTLTSEVGGQSYGVEGIMNVNISLTSSKLEAHKHLFLRVLVCKDVD